MSSDCTRFLSLCLIFYKNLVFFPDFFSQVIKSFVLAVRNKKALFVCLVKQKTWICFDEEMHLKY